MTVLSYQSIKQLCTGPTPMIIHAGPDKQFRSAGYDLRLGDEHYLSCVSDASSERIEIERFVPPDYQTLEIPPNQVALVRTWEDLAMPNDLVGRLSLKLEILLRGIIMAPQSQIDAGYQGPIYGLLYNLSDKPVVIKRFESLFRLEFAKLDAVTDKPYAGNYKPDFSLANVVNSRLGSSLSSMHQDVDGFRKELSTSKFRGTLAVIGLLLGTITLAVGLITLGVPFAQDATRAKESVDKSYPIMQSDSDKINSIQQQIIDLQHRLSQLQTPKP